jgi:CRP/FNR family transcriptional regulator, cyclic AMP receptor protein
VSPPVAALNPDDPLAGVALFSHLEPADRADLARRLRPEHHEPGQVVVWYGEPGQTLYLITAGQVRITIPSQHGHHVGVSTIDAGGVFGELSLLDGGPRTATVTTAVQTSLLALDRDDFLAFLRDRPAAGEVLLRVLAQRQRQSLELLRERPSAETEAAHHRDTLRNWSRVSSWVARQASHWWFALAHLVIYGGWVIVNILAQDGVLPAALMFDEPYAFHRLKLAMSLEGIFLSMFLLSNQRAQAARERAKTDRDRQVNLKAQTQITELSQQIAGLERLLRQPAAPANPPVTLPARESRAKAVSP